MAEKDKDKEGLTPFPDSVAGKPETPAKPLAAPLPERTAGSDACPTDQVVAAWVVEFFYNSPIARNTDCWNLLQKATEVLKQRLRGD